MVSFLRISNSTSDWLTDLSFLRAETSFAAEIVVTQLAPEAVGAQTSPVMRQLEHRMTEVVDVAPSEVLSVSRSSWGTARGEKKYTFCGAKKRVELEIAGRGVGERGEGMWREMEAGEGGKGRWGNVCAYGFSPD